jgi:fumarate reductase subunit D
MRVTGLLLWLLFGAYLVSFAPHLHAQIMLFAFGFLMPTGAITARYGKKSNMLDPKFWWYVHLSLQISGGLLALFSGWLMVSGNTSLHARLGQTTLLLVAIMLLLGLFRGDKMKVHYLMTKHRRIFEFFHKKGGWLTLMLGFATLFTTELACNVFLLFSFYIIIIIHSIRNKLWVDTHEAIWGKKQ